MIDLHGHLHAGVDDGPRNDDESLALARALVSAGVTTLACTSHVRPDKAWMNTRPGDAARIDKTRALLAAHGVPLAVVSGAEHYMDDEVIGPDVDLGALAVPYGQSRYLLVECPYHGAPADLLAILRRIQRAGFRMLLAHVERFPYLCDDTQLLERVVDMGCLVQVNLGSLSGAYSRPQQAAAERLLQRGFVAVLAGDCHREGDVADNIIAGQKAAQRLVGAEGLKRLTVDNPQKILDDAAPTRIWP